MKILSFCLAVAALTIQAVPAAAQIGSCHHDHISNIDSSGRLISLGSGQIFLVYPGQNQRSVFWLPLDQVTVCELGGGATQITDPAQKNSTVKALRQYP